MTYNHDWSNMLFKPIKCFLVLARTHRRLKLLWKTKSSLSSISGIKLYRYNTVYSWPLNQLGRNYTLVDIAFASSICCSQNLVPCKGNKDPPNVRATRPFCQCSTVTEILIRLENRSGVQTNGCLTLSLSHNPNLNPNHFNNPDATRDHSITAAKPGPANQFSSKNGPGTIFGWDH